MEADMGNRFFVDRAKNANTKCYNIWVSPHQGKYWKRKMHKARRRAWKLDGIEGKPDNKYETFCEYKGW